MAFPPPPQRRPDAVASSATVAQPGAIQQPVTLPPAPPVTATAVPTPATVAAPAAFTFGKPPVDEAAAQAKLAAEITAKTQAQADELAKQAAVVPPAAVFAPKPAPPVSAPSAAPVVKQKKSKAAFGSATIPVPAVGGLDTAAVIAAFVEFFKQPGCPALDTVAEAVKKVDQSAFPDTAAGRKAFRAGAIILAIAQWASTKKAPGQRGGDAKGPMAKYRAAMLDLLEMAGLDAVAKKWGIEKLQGIKLTVAELTAHNIACTAEQAAAYGIVA